MIHEQSLALRTAILKTIPEPRRQRDLLEVADTLEQAVKEQNQNLADLSLALQELNADYDSSREVFENAFTQFRERLGARHARVESLHFDMVHRTSPEEWKEIVENESRTIVTADTGVPALIGAGVFATGQPLVDLTDRVEDNVRDRGRRKAMVSALVEWEKHAGAFLERHGEHRRQLLEAIENHATTPEEWNGILAEMQEENRALELRALDLRYILQGKLTRDEWKAVFEKP